MEPTALLEITRRLVTQIDAGPLPMYEAGTVPAASYSSQARFDAEQAVLRRIPQVIAVAAELAQPRACLARQLAGVPILLTRDADGRVRGFRNACRHRGTQLVADGASTVCKALVCPYHGWTYDLAGSLIHLPHEPVFGDRCAHRRDLVPIHVEQRHGLIWAALDAFDLAAHTELIDPDLEWIGANARTLHARRVYDVSCNWKLLIDAGLDAYHIRQLHRDTLNRFLLDARVESETAGLHIRSVVGRRALIERGAAAVGSCDLRELVLPAYILFPTVVLAVAPDHVAMQRLTPLASDRTLVDLLLLTPHPPTTSEEREHWDKGSALNEVVFGREDQKVVEAIQRGIAAGADDSLLFGSLERPSLWFHAALDRLIPRA